MGTLIANARLGQHNSRAVKIIAKSIFKELKANGYDSRQIVSLSTELIGLVTSELKEEETPASTPI